MNNPPLVSDTDLRDCYTLYTPTNVQRVAPDTANSSAAACAVAVQQRRQS